MLPWAALGSQALVDIPPTRHKFLDKMVGDDAHVVKDALPDTDDVTSAFLGQVPGAHAGGLVHEAVFYRISPL